MNFQSPNPLPYEIHLTVRAVDRDTFVNACKHVNVKPVLLDLHARTNEIIPDAMTSQRIKGQFSDAIRVATETSIMLRIAHGIPVVRYKIETVPWHPAARAADRRSDQYFECHFPIEVPHGIVNKKWWCTLRNLCTSLNLHLSRNVFKVNEAQGVDVHMATLRDYKASPVEFQLAVEYAYRALDQSGMGIMVGAPEVEFALWDTLPSHDDRWLGHSI